MTIKVTSKTAERIDPEEVAKALGAEIVMEKLKLEDEIKLYPDPILKHKCKLVVKFDEELKQTAERMIKLIYEFNGVGLAAPQIGLDARMFVATLGNDDPTICINPEIVELKGNTIQSVEGCLSLPGVKAKLSCRNDLIDVRFYDADQNRHSRTLMAKDAIVWMHEFDHLEGRTVFNHMNSAQRVLQKAKYFKQFKKQKRK